MIRVLQESDIDKVMQIWLDTNINTHNFIQEEYWKINYNTVKEMLPQAEVYLYENDNTRQIEGFIGLNDDYIAGLFVKKRGSIQRHWEEIIKLCKKYKIKFKFECLSRKFSCRSIL